MIVVVVAAAAALWLLAYAAVRLVVWAFMYRYFGGTMKPMNRSRAPLLLGLLAAALPLTGCKVDGAKLAAYNTARATRAVADTSQMLEVNLVCGRPTAPPAPACLPLLTTHRTVEGYILQVADYDARIAELMRDVPEGRPTPLEAIALGVKVAALIQKIIAELPQHQADTLRARAAASPEPPRVVSKEEWDALIADLQRIMETARREITAAS